VYNPFTLSRPCHGCPHVPTSSVDRAGGSASIPLLLRVFSYCPDPEDPVPRGRCTRRQRYSHRTGPCVHTREVPGPRSASANYRASAVASRKPCRAHQSHRASRCCRKARAAGWAHRCRSHGHRRRSRLYRTDTLGRKNCHSHAQAREQCRVACGDRPSQALRRKAASMDAPLAGNSLRRRSNRERQDDNALRHD
jgi:hypothetical protein